MNEPMDGLPDIEQIRDAAARIAPHARVTPVMRSTALDAMCGAELHFKCEQLQRGGAFKFRGAYNFLSHLGPAARARGVVAPSSGNPAQTVTLSAKLVRNSASSTAVLPPPMTSTFLPR